MIEYWAENNAFLPYSPFTYDFYEFLVKKTPVTIFAALFGLNVYKMQTMIVVFCMMLLFVLGIITLTRKRNLKIIIFTCSPVLVHLLLSALKLYPFERRLILYTLPAVIIACSFGFDYILKTVFPKHKIERFKYITVIVFILINGLSLFIRLPVVKGRGDIKGCLEYVDENAGESKNIYIFSREYVFQYYNDIGFVKDEMTVMGGMKIDFSDAESRTLLNMEYLFSVYLGELESLLHNKVLHNNVWLLMDSDDEAKFIINKIDSLGGIKTKEFVPRGKGFHVYLYDFGE
jgi:hypothetical protein